MKYFLCTASLLFSLQLICQSQDTTFDAKKWKAPYSLAIPKDWGVERFTVPPTFAPQILYKGIEDIRFTPGWGNSKSSEYWSYAFLWFLDSAQNVSSKSLEANLKNYYSGLIKVNLDPKKIPATGIMETKVKVQKIKTDHGDLGTFSATVEMLDYMQLKPIILNSVIHFRQYKQLNKTIVFYELSPKPFSDNVWLSLNQLWDNFSY